MASEKAHRWARPFRQQGPPYAGTAVRPWLAHVSCLPRAVRLRVSVCTKIFNCRRRPSSALAWKEWATNPPTIPEISNVGDAIDNTKKRRQRRRQKRQQRGKAKLLGTVSSNPMNQHQVPSTQASSTKHQAPGQGQSSTEIQTRYHSKSIRRRTAGQLMTDWISLGSHAIGPGALTLQKHLCARAAQSETHNPNLRRIENSMDCVSLKLDSRPPRRQRP